MRLYVIGAQGNRSCELLAVRPRRGLRRRGQTESIEDASRGAPARYNIIHTGLVDDVVKAQSRRVGRRALRFSASHGESADLLDDHAEGARLQPVALLHGLERPVHAMLLTPLFGVDWHAKRPRDDDQARDHRLKPTGPHERARRQDAILRTRAEPEDAQRASSTALGHVRPCLLRHRKLSRRPRQDHVELARDGASERGDDQFVHDGDFSIATRKQGG